MGDCNFRPSPTESTPLNRSSKIWYRWLCRRTLRLCQLWCKSVDGGLLGKWLKHNEFFYLYLFSSTHLQVRPVDGFSRMMAQTTLTRARMCLLGVSLTLLPILGVKSPVNPNCGGVSRRFQAKRAKYWKFHVIETTASISTKFCTTIETIIWSSWVVPIGAQQIHYSRWRTAAILKKNVKSPYLCNSLTDFDKIWHSDAHWPLTADLSLKFRIFENLPSWKITKIVISPQRFDRSLLNLLRWCKIGLLTARPLKIEFQKSKMANSCHFENRYIILYLQPFDWFW